MKALTLLSILILALTAAPVAAAQDTTRGFINPMDRAFIVAHETRASGIAEARSLYRGVNSTRLIESEFSVMVMESEQITGVKLRGLGADEATLYGVIEEEDYWPGLLLIARSGTQVYIIVMLGEELDGRAFAQFASDVMSDGLTRTNAPAGFYEMDMDEQEDATSATWL